MDLRKLVAPAALLVLLATPLPAVAAGTRGTETGKPSEASRFEYALSLYRQGAYDPAVKEFKDFVRDFPRGEYTDDAWYWLGKYYMMNGGYEEALAQFSLILTELPSSDKAAQAQYEIASYWADPANPRHDYEKAIAEFTKLPFFYADSPLVDDAAYYSAICQVRLKRYAKAQEAFRSFIQKYPESGLAAAAQYELGVSYLLSANRDEALAAFQAVRDNYPAGLYRHKALDSIELIMRANGKRPPAHSYTYGEKGSGPGAFAKPTGIAVGPDGELYVTDSGNARIQVFNSHGSGLTVENPGLVQLGVDRNLTPVRPAGIAVGPDGLVYITDTSLNRVQVIGKDGKPVLSFGRHGPGAGEMDSPVGIAVDEGGNIYVADKGNRRVEKFDASGRFVKAIGSSGPEDSQLRSPAGVAIDMEGCLLVTDDSMNRVYRFDDAGNLTGLFGEGAPNAYPLKDPAGIAVDMTGNVYVTDRGRVSVIVLDKDLKPLSEYKGGDLSDPSGIAVSGAGELFVADQGRNKVVVLK